MDFEGIVGTLIFIFWILSQVAAAAKKNKERKELESVDPIELDKPRATQQRRRPRSFLASDGQAKGMLRGLASMESEAQATLPQLDEKVGAQLSYAMETRFLPEAKELHAGLEASLSGQASTAIAELVPRMRAAQALLAEFKETVRAARLHTSLRRRRELIQPHRVADGLVDPFQNAFREYAGARGIALEQGPAAALVWNATTEGELGATPLAASTIFVPRSVTVDPRYWYQAGQEIGRYIGQCVPATYEEIYTGLALQTAETNLEDGDGLSRLLFASWMGQIVNDTSGASLLGPAYLRALAALESNARLPARVTSVHLTQDGTVQPECPAHVRVHLTAQWLRRMGESRDADDVTRAWDAMHGDPQSLSFLGTGSAITLEPVLATTRSLVDQLFQLRIEALGNSPLAQVPGLANWNAEARDASDAVGSLATGSPAKGSARALIAAAISATLSNPGQAAAIREGLYASFEAASARPAAKAKPKSAKTRQSKPMAAVQPTRTLRPVRRRSRKRAVRSQAILPVASHELIESLLLSEIILDRRSR